MSAFPDRWELKEMASSGADVPKETTVSPIMVVDILKFLARLADPSTKKSAHLMSKMNPIIANPILSNNWNNPLEFG